MGFFLRVTKYLHSTVDLGKVTVRDHLRWLVADTDLEASWAPIDELDSALGLKGCNSDVGVLWNNITTVKQTGCHVLSVTRIALHHLVVWLKAGHRDLLHRVGLVGCLSSRDNWGVCDKREVNSWVWHQVGLELVEIDIQGAIETKGGSDGGDDCEQLVQVASGL